MNLLTAVCKPRRDPPLARAIEQFKIPKTHPDRQVSDDPARRDARSFCRVYKGFRADGNHAEIPCGDSMRRFAASRNVTFGCRNTISVKEQKSAQPMKD